MAVGLAVIILLSAVMMNTITAAAEGDGKLTYSVYPYLPDAGYYAEVLEGEWEKRHSDIRLEYVPYDCYFGGKPEGIDVIMYDVIMERAFIEKGYIRSIDISDCLDTDDFYTKAWIIPGTEDLRPYIYGKTLVRKWVGMLVGFPILAAVLAGIMQLI